MSRKPIQLILDFDSTLTKKDTLHLIAEAGYRRQQTSSKRRILPPWQDIVDVYLSDYEAHSSKYGSEISKRKTLLSETAWLESLQGVERASAERVNDAGIFDNVTKQDMQDAAVNALQTGSLELRHGWAELLATVHKANEAFLPKAPNINMLQLVSVSWSRWFVWNVVWKAATSLSDHELARQVMEALTNTALYANEPVSIIVETDSPWSSIPIPCGQPMTIRTAGDKLRYMQLETLEQRAGSDRLKVYVGDSPTDLECLVMADVGICIRDHIMNSGQKELQFTCERIGLSMKSLDEYEEARRSASTLEELEKTLSHSPVTLYFVHDFHEIVRWMNRIMSTAS